MTESQPNSLEFHQVPLSYRDWWDTLHNDRQDLLNRIVSRPLQAHETINSMGVPNTFFPDMFSAFTLGGDTQRSAVLDFFHDNLNRRPRPYQLDYNGKLEEFFLQYSSNFPQLGEQFRTAVLERNDEFPLPNRFPIITPYHPEARLLIWLTSIFRTDLPIDQRKLNFHDLTLLKLDRYFQDRNKTFDIVNQAVPDLRNMLHLYRLEPNRLSWGERIRNFFFETTASPTLSSGETITIRPTNVQPSEPVLVITYQDLLNNRRRNTATRPLVEFATAVTSEVSRVLDTPAPEEWLNFGLSPSSKAEFSSNKISLVENDPQGVEEIVVSFEFKPNTNTVTIAFDKELDDHLSLVSLDFSVDRQGTITHSLTPDQIHLIQTYGIFYRLQGLQGKCLYTHRYHQTFQQLQQPLKMFGESLSKHLN